jgi:hypothetical protein|tara:strand:- start:43 stop:234 length:192 start_codon:yes stop_codon:yes gene_type:complete
MKEIICYRYVDEDNFPRVWGSGKTEEEAKTQCNLALREYIWSKPKNAQRYYFTKKYKLEKCGL